MCIRDRGTDSAEKAALFLQQSPLFDPFLLKDMEKAVQRIGRAIDEQERICVYGDYDCDGITATVMLYQYLQAIGADVVTYIPDREKEGYGLHPTALDRLKEQGVVLVVTVDNGCLLYT